MSSPKMHLEKGRISLRIDWDLKIFNFEFCHFKDLVWKKYFDFEYINELDGWLMTSALGLEPPNVCIGSSSVRKRSI